ncbi:MAG TPA: uroporphyrinogen decarboxylase family protein [Armatimonadota bacterium]|jgi:uroporphyrinogen decarboxylase
MNDRERFLATMNYAPRDRAPFWYWGPWPETVERWKTEGYDESFDLSMGADGRTGSGHWWNPQPPFAYEVLEEDAETILFINHEGILMRQMKNQPMSSMPQFVRFPVETRADFRKFWAEHMTPDLTARIGPDWQAQLRAERLKPLPYIVISDRWGGFFGPLRNLVGVERLCTLFYDDPAFVQEMMEANADLTIAIMDQVLDVIDIDAFGFWEDMAYKTGPLLSPAMARKYMLPNYVRVVEFLRGRGVQIIGLDSDGQIDSLIPVWRDAGLNMLYPFETQAGMDVLEVRRKYGQDLLIWGGVDKRALTHGPAAIDAELERLRPLIEEGGYMPHTDHSIPPDVSFANFRYYMEKLAEVCGA